MNCDSGNMQLLFDKALLIVPRIRAKMTVHVHNGMNIVWGSIRQNRINAYWWSKFVNFGDLMTPTLLASYGLTPVLVAPATSEVVATGSILEHIPEDYSGIILGSGLMYQNSVRCFRNARILAVRGELTRLRIQAPKEVILGDPGLLVSRIFTGTGGKRYTLGIIPHFREKRDPRLTSIHQRYKRDTIIINVQRDPIKVIQDIDQCEGILSSSLHGVICADALGIPNARLYLSDKIPGGAFKFADYHSALHVQREPVRISGDEKLSDLIRQLKIPPETILKIKNDLHHVFLTLKEEKLSDHK